SKSGLHSFLLSLRCARRLHIRVAFRHALIRHSHAIRLQSWQRMVGPWKAYQKLKSATVALQCRLRQKIAYAELEKLRPEAKERAAGATIAAGAVQVFLRKTAHQLLEICRSQIVTDAILTM
ncbi:unnamed protein product, partial [Ascophyllum nodosum]